ncbi:NrfD/PsrC family molybdoenzyme membrane anchor subunit [Sulfurimonas autotrophica]|uniref:Polysulphide reductase NrfD n=1 Tax=Sulfurimonas autotrophica (strain ATCC BAA-671 / DSM 16294 / JCM 11897 / OK10) TaxID=563040 RepID=E0UPE0_SULAO|nr:NrfD/PsrC family molybdoenzyme membrane anchor subunit [Sulfurimonas autotrophica]ADN09670.1 Polysulphide reductase NrfD [Sulfurimonas autotrophica DSM 16294]
MIHESLAATHAVVTLDVALPDVFWGWFVTMNMWAKSIGTGLIFMLFLLLRKNSSEMTGLRTSTLIVSFIMMNIFLLFTLADLHQPFRMWHIFFYPHWTSAITVGAWMATVFVGLEFLMIILGFQKKTESFDKLLFWVTLLAIPVTLYTAGIMAEASARELWQMSTESVQMILAATLSGSAAMILLGGSKLSDETKQFFGAILGLSALLAFIIYMSEYIFGGMKSEEVTAILAHVKGNGEYSTMFWIGQWVAYILPMLLVALSRVSKSNSLLSLAAILAIVGLWVVKHVWLVIPQLLPLS